MSDNAMLGQFELLVKRYDGGAASQYLYELKPGATVEFKHIPFNIKAQYPFEGKTSFTLICAGTGITPMFQALWKLLGTAGDERKVTMLYGNKTPGDILMKARAPCEGAAASLPRGPRALSAAADRVHTGGARRLGRQVPNTLQACPRGRQPPR
jgi:ferredoxin-NADP reductase